MFLKQLIPPELSQLANSSYGLNGSSRFRRGGRSNGGGGGYMSGANSFPVLGRGGSRGGGYNMNSAVPANGFFNIQTK